MSTINTNGIDVNYPVPGQNNSSQGFRDNFTSIKNNLDVAGTEITDLQNKVVLKSALANLSLNNDMANTLISNASTRSFRATTYNLGNALAGTVVIDASLADVQYGAVDENVTLQFGKWSPAGTEQSIELQLYVSNTNASITFPSEVVSTNNNYGATLLENFQVVGNVMTITAPYAAQQLNYKLTTQDCGNVIYIEPINRPFKTTQVQKRTPSPTGFKGDVAGTVAVDANYFYVCTGNYNANTIVLKGTATSSVTNQITCNTNPTTAGVVANMPVIFDTMEINGSTTTTFGNLVAGTTYYVKTVGSSFITVSNTRSGGVAGATYPLANVTANATTSMDATFYSGSNIWTRISLSTW